MELHTLNTDITSTICAISTPHGVGGIAVIRISGPQAVAIAQKCWRGKSLMNVSTHTAHLGYIVDPANSEEIDQAVATVFLAPNSYTGQDTVELSVHGSIYVQQRTVDALIAAGAQPATAGEFTRRAFANGRIDLLQAEAIADLIDARNHAAHSLAMRQLHGSVTGRIQQLRQQLIELSALLELELDFSEEDVTFADRSQLLKIATDIDNHIKRLIKSFRSGNAIRNGIPIAIVGATNAGKSSTLNALLDHQRAIVSDIHGTTRDIVEDTLTIEGTEFRLMDTAGLRDTDDRIEQLGIQRSIDSVSHAAVVILVIDSTQPLPEDTISQIQNTLNAENPEATLLTTINKSDIGNTDEISDRQKKLSDKYNIPTDNIIVTSTQPDEPNISCLRQRLADIARQLTSAIDDTIITNRRQMLTLSDAADSIRHTIDALRDGIPADLIAEHLRATLHHLSLLTGDITTDTLLATIFTRFCIGK